MLEYFSPNVLSDLSKAYENRTGVTFSEPNATVRAYFKAPVNISTVALQPTYNGLTTNITKFSVFYLNWDGTPYLDPNTGQVLTFTTADNDTSLTIQHDIIPNLKGLNLTILEPSVGKSTYFRLEVLGCYKGSKSSYFH
jgi:hypothetical protein